ncbi:hypothetical protein SAMN05216532_0114 [Streptomyces sp. 2231.1]|uniref:hypothetical protein n=1 Tax=Streptomyces sp. 2231.1 TaxID=1855347 RepID=UPI0008982303|nr:hypothetical protein [Streptomyces sp. 2231.1]SEB98779.1 hypothetical protein SAMN05216532_0114 [Streptomyces sp. 2231.1]
MNDIPAAYGAGLRVFLAAPFAQFIDPADGLVQPEWRQRLSALRTALLNAGHAVFNAHYNEGWGEWGLSAQECVLSDFRALQCADLVLAYPGTPASTGVALELGWASALRKPAALLLDPATVYSPMIAALGEVSPVLSLPFGDWTEESVNDAVHSALDWADALGIRPGPWGAPNLDTALAYCRASAEGNRRDGHASTALTGPKSTTSAMSITADGAPPVTAGPRSSRAPGPGRPARYFHD